jgi:L-lactate dehydrogenase complex protein LldG
MNSREVILQRIRAGIATMPETAPPPVPEVWPRLKPDAAAMARQFEEELKAVQGEVVHCRDMAEARRQLAQLVGQAAGTTVGAMDRPACREAVGDLPKERVHYPRPGWPPREMAELAWGLIAPEALLADTGSCVVACPTAEDRLLCYLPPACAVIARRAQLFEHLPAAWETLLPHLSGQELRGEHVIITGPSRTADIEKTLILGVHGPKRLVVLLVE